VEQLRPDQHDDAKKPHDQARRDSLRHPLAVGATRFYGRHPEW
jgi:hypothetical protein